MKGSIALARSLCYQINGAADDSDDIDGGGYGSVDVAEILSAEVVRLREALAQLEQQAEPVADRAFLEQTLVAMEGVIDVADRNTDEFDALRACVVDLTLMLYTTLPQQQAEPPPEWPLVKNILDEYGLDAISFVADWKAAQQQAEPPQREWQGLTDEAWVAIDNKKGTALDTFTQGAVWAESQLMRRNT